MDSCQNVVLVCCIQHNGLTSELNTSRRLNWAFRCWIPRLFEQRRIQMPKIGRYLQSHVTYTHTNHAKIYLGFNIYFVTLFFFWSAFINSHKYLVHVFIAIICSIFYEWFFFGYFNLNGRYCIFWTEWGGENWIGCWIMSNSPICVYMRMDFSNIIEFFMLVVIFASYFFFCPSFKLNSIKLKKNSFKNWEGLSNI